MIRRQFAKRALVVLTGVWTLVATGPVLAIDVDLPGERRLQIHGFYEFRLRTWGEDLPANGMTLSQFRQVLNVETELDILPEGAGPFDFMMGYARLLTSYECIYRRGCGTFKNIDSYGGEHREASRVPRNFKRQRTRTGSIGGAFPQRFFPGSLRQTGGITVSKPGGRYQDCFIPNGSNVTSAFLGGFCNLDNRSELQPPIDLFLAPSARTRGGVVHPGISKNLLRAGRPELGHQRFLELNELPVLDEQPDFTTSSSRFGSGVLNGQARAFLAERTRAEARGDPATSSRSTTWG